MVEGTLLGPEKKKPKIIPNHLVGSLGDKLHLSKFEGRVTVDPGGLSLPWGSQNLEHLEDVLPVCRIKRGETGSCSQRRAQAPILDRAAKKTCSCCPVNESERDYNGH